jgi:UDP-3-O-[3-hydroxymyristoyl] glucosamine N-acyltransferase
VGFAGHITVGDMNGIGAQTGVDNSIGSNGKWLGAPVQPAMEFARQVVYLKRLGDMYRDIKELKKKLKD